ncbi:MAG: V-type ATP synthase subunit F [Oscillospiraceae bacterium]|nr:V-type ATP synthase subunit F [Oscillospiraceae bacterium]
MKYFLISDNIDTQAGLRLAGIEGVVAHTRAETAAALEKAYADPETAVVLMTPKLCAENRELVYDYKLNRPVPLLVEVPDRHSGDDAGAGIRASIADAVGIKI